jgi:hypothetical protein
MSVVDLGAEDDGFQEFSFAGNTIKIDVFQVLNKLSGIRTRHAQFNDPDVFWLEDVVALLKEYGLDNISTAVAAKFVKSLNIIAEEVKKNIG